MTLPARVHLLLFASAVILLAAPPVAARPDGVVLDTAEPEAVLAILDALNAGADPADAAWDRLFATVGYRRLKEREAAMKRDFTDDDFRAFVLDPALRARAPELWTSLEAWRRVDIAGAVTSARAYLPPDAPIDVTIHPSIKPKGNSFVWDLGGDPTIFMYLDPAVPSEQLANTLAHELHHIGLGAACDGEGEEPPEPLDSFATWLGAFGEGMAMLAAAGGPDIHPLATHPDTAQSRWDRDAAAMPADLDRVDAFFRGILDGTLAGGAVRKAGFAFFGWQGPWYTVGWKMWTLVERERGRAVLVEHACDYPRLILIYDACARARNAAGADPAWPLWSDAVLAACRRIAES